MILTNLFLKLAYVINCFFAKIYLFKIRFSYRIFSVVSVFQRSLISIFLNPFFERECKGISTFAIHQIFLNIFLFFYLIFSFLRASLFVIGSAKVIRVLNVANFFCVYCKNILANCIKPLILLHCSFCKKNAIEIFLIKTKHINAILLSKFFIYSNCYIANTICFLRLPNCI